MSQLRRCATQRTVAVVVLAVEILCLAAMLRIELPRLWEQRWVQDDAYVSFRYARNFVNGHGLVYNIGQRVEGYTNFSWTMLSAIPIARGTTDPLPFMHGVGAFLWLLSYGLLIVLGAVWFRAGAWIGPIAVVPLLPHYSFNLWFVSGMETPLVTAFLISCILFFTLDPKRFPWAPMLCSGSAVGLMMTRPDGIVVLGGLGIAAIALHGRELWRNRRTFVLGPTVPVLLVFLPFTLWRVHYYGSLLPNTYYAKVGYLTHYQRGWDYLWMYLRAYQLRWALLLLLLGTCVAPAGTIRRYLVACTAVTFAVFWYVVRLGGDFMEWRFLVPVTAVLYPAIVLAAGSAAARVLGPFAPPPFAPVAALGGATVAALLFWSATATASATNAKDARIDGQESIGLLSRYAREDEYDWYGAARVFDEVLPRNASVATSSAGIIPFFLGDRFTLDLCGLTDPVIARRAVDPNNRGRMGHEVCLEQYEETRQRGINFYLRWVDPKPYPNSLFAELPEALTMVSVDIGRGRYTDMVLLDPSGIDLAAMRKNSRLVFPDSQPTVDRTVFYLAKEELRGLEIVDSFDFENATDHAAHSFQERFPMGGIHDFHAKMLTYRDPHGELTLLDDEFLPQDAEWDVRNVRAGRDLTMVVRYDTGTHGDYAVEINGNRLPELLVFEGLDVVHWDEIHYVIPARFLKEGTNRMRLLVQSRSRAEIAYAWYLQH